MKTTTTVLCASPYCYTDPETDELMPREAAHGLNLCYPCRQRVINQCGELATVYAGDLEAALLTTGRGGDFVTGTAERGLPIGMPAADARAEIREHLRVWSTLVAENLGITPAGFTELALSDYLLAHTDWLAAHSDAGKYAACTHDVWRQAMRAAYPAGTRRIALSAHCPMPDCPGEVSALIRPAEHRLSTAIACDDNPGHAWTKQQWIALAPHLGEPAQLRWMSVEEVAALLDRTPNAVHCLAYRQRWTRFVEHGRTFYDPADVAATLPA